MYVAGSTDARPRERRWRRPTALGIAIVLALAVAGFLVVGATGADGHGPQLQAWDLPAPALPIPVDVSDAAPAGATKHDGATTGATSPTGSDTAAADAAPQTLPSGAPSDAQVEAELRRALRSSGDATISGRSLVSAATVTPDGMATVPPDAPPKVAAIINAGNQVARKPYVYGGGHGRFAGEIWSDTAYDCSGSISYTLAAAGLIDAPMTSGELADWGEPGPGKWVTIYANAGHTFMYVAGLRFDTSGRAQTGSRWQAATRSTAGFTVVHPKGL